MKRLVAALVSIWLLLALPTSAHGAITNTDPWIYNVVTTSQGTFNHYVRVCDYGVPSLSMHYRIIDALNEWNEIDGELFFEWMSSWNDATCDSEMAYSPLPTIMITHGSLSGTLVGQTQNDWVNASGRIYNCVVRFDSYAGDPNRWHVNGVVGYWYTSTGSPSANRIDFESVLVHEMGHCLAVDGHLDYPSGAVMYGCMDPECDSPPVGIEKDENGIYDIPLYGGMYGYSH